LFLRTISASLSAAADHSVVMVAACARRPSSARSSLDVVETAQALLAISKEVCMRFYLNFIFKLTRLVQK
jgi:hypothetical protein